MEITLCLSPSTGRRLAAARALCVATMAAEQVSWRQRKKDAVTAMLASGSEAGDRMRASRIAALLAVRWGRAAQTPHAS